MADGDETTPEDRLNTIMAIWQGNEWLYAFVGFVLGLLAYPLVTIITSDFEGFMENLVPEAVGITFTVLFIDQLNRRRDERRQIEELRERLVREAGSTSNEVAKAAISELYKRGWLRGEDGLLAGTNLYYANLAGANLYYANLVRTSLRGTNLSGADLIGADLTGADLGAASLRDAKLIWEDPRTGERRQASMTGTTFNERTILPDGTRWKPGTDMRAFGAQVDDAPD